MTDTIPATGKTQHTALPWEFEEGHIQRDSGGISYWQITDGQDAIACNQFCYAGYEPAINSANAAFIVRACNSHYQLVSALREAIEELWDRDHSSMDRIQFERANASLFTALSQAGGE